MDTVYVLGSGSIWDNNELRYSLLSVQRYLRGWEHIYIVGARPPIDCLQNTVIHIPYPDSNNNKEKNICDKIVAACNDPRISEHFLFMNDDHFLLQPQDVVMPYYCQENLQIRINRRRHNDVYRASLQNTLDALKTRNLPTTFFDVHTPIVYGKSKFKEVMALYDWNIRNGYVIKSLYCNTLRITGQPFIDLKIDQPMNKAEILKLVRGRKIFSIGDGAFNGGIKEAMGEVYGNLSSPVY